ncbi:MAG: hypothetical protein DMG17_07555 [Acidobacteria bacterium]|nr:MAG: hypothetical protein DMG17_07555 [Acidobacteriota bacterium]
MSVTTSSSTQFPPAFRISVRSEGQDVRVRPSYFLQRQGSFMLDVLLIEMTNTLSLFNGRLSFKKIRDAKWRRPFWEEEGGP